MGFELCHRPRNAAATRASILAAASKRFSAESYDQVGMRDIAGDVGVDPALISRYFGSKEDLFLAVLEDCGKGSDIMDGPRAEFGQRLARELVYGPRNETKLDWLLIMLRSSSSPKAAEVLKKSADRFFLPFIVWIGGDHASVRARMAAGLLMGLAVSRDIGGGFNLSEEECEEMCARLASTLQGFIDN